jgi:hypothetical protein
MVNKVKINIDVDEWYPVYNESDFGIPSYENVEFTQYELFKIRRTFQEFDHVQKMIEKRIKEAGHDI